MMKLNGISLFALSPGGRGRHRQAPGEGDAATQHKAAAIHRDLNRDRSAALTKKAPSPGRFASALSREGRGQKDNTAPVIRVRNLSKCFGRQVIFDGLDLDVYRGEVLGIAGASGTGKSVLLRCIIGLVPADKGRVEMFGRDMAALDRKERLEIRRRWGVLFQDGALFSSLTVLENIQVPMREQLKLPKSALDDLAFLKLTMVGLDPDAAYKYPSQLSGGMRKRAGLARALALDPEIVFLDEPTSGLDPIGAAAFDQLIRRLQQTLGLTVYMVTHDLDSIFTICDRVAVLAGQKVVRTGQPSELVSEPQHSWVRDYFCGERARAVIRAT